MYSLNIYTDICIKPQPMKKFLKILGISIIIVIILLAIVPYLFQDQIEQSLKNSINKNVKAKVEWSELNLSLLADFPNAEVNLEKVSVINRAPFAGDTLFYAQNFEIHMGLFQLFNADNLVIDDIAVKEANINVLVNQAGETNYDIQKTSQPQNKKPEDTTGQNGFKLELQSYSITNSKIRYKDASALLLNLSNFNHSGKGDFTKNTFTLSTETDSKVSFTYDSTAYLKQNHIKLEADIEMDLDQMRFTFKENEAFINQLPLEFDGFVQIFDDRQELNIKFSTPDSDFKNLLALVPEAYAGNLDGIDTKGEFSLDGKLYGKIDDTYIPKIDIELSSEDSEFQYETLPNKMEDINLDLKILNSTGLIDDTAIDINRLDFRIGKDKFRSSFHLNDLTQNMKIDIVAKGIINLTNLSQTYPLEANLDLNGILDMDLETHFDMNSIDKQQYQNVKSKGRLELNSFKYTSEDLANPFIIEKAKVSFNQATAKLSSFKMKTGQTDIQANGQLNNLIGYMFSDQDLSGNFQAMSSKFVVSDFMTSSAENSTPEDPSANEKPSIKEEVIKIPAKLDLGLNFTASEVVYHNFNLKNTVGKLSIKDQNVNLSQIQADIFGGQVVLDGRVSTKSSIPNFGLNLKLQKIDIASSIENIEMLKSFTPILKSLVGVISTEFDFSGDMTKGLSPILTTLNGTGLANIIQAKVEPLRMPLANSLNSQLNVIDLNKLSIKDITTSFRFENGNINVKPLRFEIEDIKVDLQGKHSLNNNMDYEVKLKLPAKYFGDEIGGQLALLGNSNLDEMKVDLPLNITGPLTKPQINIDMETAVTDLTNQIIEQQKDDVIDKATDKLSDMIGGAKTTNTPKDSTATQNDNVEETVKNVLGGLLNKKKKKKEDNN